MTVHRALGLSDAIQQTDTHSFQQTDTHSLLLDRKRGDDGRLRIDLPGTAVIGICSIAYRCAN
jgi:hypothetical protein